jgi:hypothetical protein
MDMWKKGFYLRQIINKVTSTHNHGKQYKNHLEPCFAVKESSKNLLPKCWEGFLFQRGRYRNINKVFLCTPKDWILITMTLDLIHHGFKSSSCPKTAPKQEDCKVYISINKWSVFIHLIILKHFQTIIPNIH